MFPSQLNPGTKSAADVHQRQLAAVDAIQGLGAYPFADQPSLTPDGATLQSFPTGAALPTICRRCTRAFTPQFNIVEELGEPRARVVRYGTIRKYLPMSYRDVVQLHDAPHRVREDRRQLSLRGQAMVEAE